MINVIAYLHPHELAYHRVVANQHVEELAKDNATHYTTQKSFVTLLLMDILPLNMTGPTLGSTSPEHRPYGPCARNIHDSNSMQTDHHVSRDDLL